MKQSWDTQKIWMKWLKVSLSLFMLLESSEKNITNHVVCSKASIFCIINAVALKGQQHVGNSKKPSHKMTGTFARLSRPTGSCESPNSWLSQKWICALGWEVSTATTFCYLWEIGFHCHKPATKPLLNCKQKLKQVQWANMHKDCTKMMWFLCYTLPVFTGLGQCPIVYWDFVGAVSIFGPDALPVVYQWLLPGLKPATSWVRVAAHNH